MPFKIKLLEKYILKKYLNWFLIFYIGINLLIILLEFLGHVDSFIKHPIEFYKVYKKYLYLTFPIIIYFSISFFFYELKKNKEYIVIESLGINILHTFRSLFIFFFILLNLVYFQAKFYGYSYEKIVLLVVFSFISIFWGIIISQEKDFSFVILGFVTIFSIFNILSSMINYHIIDKTKLITISIILIIATLGIFIKIEKKQGFL